MSKKTIKTRLARFTKINIIILTISLTTLILISPFLYLSYNEKYYNMQAEKNNVYDKLDKSVVKTQNENTINFLLGKERLKGNYTLNELKHMEDVKKIYSLLNTSFLTTTILIILTSVILIRKNKKEDIKNAIKYSAKTTSILIIILTILIMIDFTKIFQAFHMIFFPQGNYSFSSTTLLKTLYPDVFFLNTAINGFILSLTISLSILMIMIVPKKINTILKRHYKKKK